MEDDEDPFGPEPPRNPALKLVGVLGIVMGIGLVLLAGFGGGGGPFSESWVGEIILGAIGVGIAAVGYRVFKGAWPDLDQLGRG